MLQYPSPFAGRELYESITLICWRLSATEIYYCGLLRLDIETHPLLRVIYETQCKVVPFRYFQLVADILLEELALMVWLEKETHIWRMNELM